LKIDEETGTDFWQCAINKEMAKVRVAWKVNESCTPEQVWKGLAPNMIGFQEIGCHIVLDIKIGFQEIGCHIVFDIKMSLTCKA